MTEPNLSPPWPRTWPPFWRDVLHVAIAVGVGNLVFVGCFLPLRRLLPCWGGLSSSITAIVIVAVLGLVGRADRHAIRALLVTFLLAPLVFAPALRMSRRVFGVEALMDFHRYLEDVFGYSLGTTLWLGIADLPEVVLQFVVMGLLFRVFSRQALSHRVLLVLILGVVLRFTGWLWVGTCTMPAVFSGLVSNPMQVQVWRFLSSMSFLTFITLGYALVAKVMLTEMDRRRQTV